MTAFLVALQFLTRLPPLLRRMPTEAELGRAVGFFPLVGLVVGGAAAGIGWAAGQWWPPGVAAGLALASWIGVTGALHLDGFLDACDGLLGGHTPEARLAIMRDERIGAFALAGGVLLLLLKFAALEALLAEGAFGRAVRILLLAPVLGRFVMSLAVVAFPYARPDGLGRTLVDRAGRRELALATLLAGGAAWILMGPPGLLGLVGVGLLTWPAAWWVMGRIPGLTGDIYGGLCELTELVILLGFTWTG